MTGAVVVYGVWFLFMAAWVAALVDAGRRPHVEFQRVHNNKGLVMVLLIIAGCLGTAYWFAVLRPRIVKATARAGGPAGGVSAPPPPSR